MARRAAAKVEAVEPDMTPMIDCVFQLMIFFILCTEVAAADLELLKLPSASEALPDKNPEDKRMILNVNKAGEIKHRGKVKTQAELFALLKLEAALVPDKDNKQLSGRSVIIRGDVDAEYRHVNTIMLECAKVGIWKLELGAAAPHDK